MQLDDVTVQRTVDGLSKKHLIIEKSGFGSRVPKYQHRFCNTEYGKLKLDPQELAIVCELLLRGPQTPGELRGRASRMASFSDVTEVEAVLTMLAGREEGPFVTRLAREPGRRDARYAHLFSGAPAAEHGAAAGQAPIDSVLTQGARAGAVLAEPALAEPAPELSFPQSRTEDRLAKIETEVQALRWELDDLKRRLGG
jgi:hypothetical protein